MLSNIKKSRKLKNIILANTLSLGQHPQFTNKKLTLYIYGTKNNIEFFRITELRYIMLRLYPFIKSLFKNYCPNPILFDQMFSRRTNSNSSSNTRSTPKGNWLLSEKVQPMVIRKPIPYYKLFRIKSPTIQILFATTTSNYIEIIKTAAQRCHMPFHVGRWLVGALTARADYIKDTHLWRPLLDIETKAVNRYFQKHHNNQKSITISPLNEDIKVQKAKQPALIIIPDATKSAMIIRESQRVGVPIIGLVNSTTLLSIDYPLLGNNLSIHSVHFFCFFLSSLIAKEAVRSRYSDVKPLGFSTKSTIENRKKTVILRRQTKLKRRQIKLKRRQIKLKRKKNQLWKSKPIIIKQRNKRRGRPNKRKRRAKKRIAYLQERNKKSIRTNKNKRKIKVKRRITYSQTKRLSKSSLKQKKFFLATLKLKMSKLTRKRRKHIINQSYYRQFKKMLGRSYAHMTNETATRISLILSYKLLRRKPLQFLWKLFVNATTAQKIQFIRTNKALYLLMIRSLTVRTNLFNTHRIVRSEGPNASAFIFNNPLLIAFQLNDNQYWSKQFFLLYYRTLHSYLLPYGKKKQFRRSFRYAANPYYWRQSRILSENVFLLQKLDWLQFSSYQKFVQWYFFKWEKRRFWYRKYLKWRTSKKTHRKRPSTWNRNRNQNRKLN